MLRVRSDEQLVALFRRGNEHAFRAIHDRYHDRLTAYARQMLPSCAQDAEDVTQDVFVRAYWGLRSATREVSLRPWLYRVAHNRCIDQLRRRIPPAVADVEEHTSAAHDPFQRAQQREDLQRLVQDIRRLPEQQRSALLMRELGGMSYDELSEAIGVSVPAVKSLLVRARVGLARAAEARDASCAAIQEQLILAHDQRVRPGAMARRHLGECSVCTQFRREMRGTSRQMAALAPGLGFTGAVAKLLGLSGGGSATVGSASGGGAAAAGGGAAAGAAGTGVGIALLGGGTAHFAGLLAAAVVTAGGAMAFDPVISSQSKPVAAHHAGPASASPSSASVHSDTPSGASAALPAAITDAPVAAAQTVVASVTAVATPHRSRRPAAARHLGVGTTTEVVLSQQLSQTITPLLPGPAAPAPASTPPPAGDSSSSPADPGSGVAGSITSGTPTGTPPATSSGTADSTSPGTASPASSSTGSSSPSSSSQTSTSTPGGQGTGQSTPTSGSGSPSSSSSPPPSGNQGSASDPSSSGTGPGSGSSATNGTGSTSSSSSSSGTGSGSSSSGSTSSGSGSGSPGSSGKSTV